MDTPAPPAETALIAVDTGGTFTDVVCLYRGELSVLKLPSTPSDPATAVLEGIRRLLPDAPYVLIHGSTVATNALLERRGARVVLVTNRGFEDVLEIGRQNRPQLYTLAGRRPPPLVAGRDRHGIAGRLGPDGAEEAPLDPAELDALPNRLAGAEAVAVCLLHSYANPAHEAAVGRALASADVPVSISSELLREYREYERTATTVVNAYVAPRVGRYLRRLESESSAAGIRIMGSGGGTLSVDRARREPVHTVLSGPAGGVAGALDAAREMGIARLMSFDMGGTSTDVSLCPGRPLHTREFRIAGLPLATPVLDIHTVGAGGGSLARMDAGGSLRVGPESAGAEPGPICYGRGGSGITVTDAHLWLGRLPTDAFRIHGRPLDRAAVEGPLRELADAMGTDPDAAAEGVLAVADTAMEGALRVISVERGYDPADFALVPFGGAAGLHAAELASRLGIRQLLLPPEPGVLSAFGMLVSPARRDLSRTVLLVARPGDVPSLEEPFREMEAEARAALERDGIDPARVAMRRSVDARYAGQSFELRVPERDWVREFHQAHSTRYGFADPDADVEAVTLRLDAVSTEPRPPTRRPHGATHRGSPAADRADVLYRGARVSAARYAREALRQGQTFEGPAIVTEYTATAWIPPGWIVEAAASGALIATRTGT